MIINFLPIASGGGLQNTLSFIEELPDYFVKDCIAIVRENSLVEEAAITKGFTIFTVKSGILNRLIFEVKARKIFHKNDICFTLFGPPIISLVNFTYNINGFAYSNLLYPNIDFWWFKPFHQKIKSKAIDIYRKYLISFSDEIIYETKLLQEKSLADPLLKSVKSQVVNMAASSLVGPDKVAFQNERFNKIKALNGYKLLFLAGSQPNKRIKEFIATLAVLNANNNKKFYMFLTMEESTPYLKSIMREADRLGVEQYLINLQPVAPSLVSTLIHHCDAMVNVALLESFSNNFIAAWKMEKLLVTTDADWAIESCGDAAQYIDITKPIEAADKITFMLENKNSFLEAVAAQLSKYPSSKVKTQNYLNIIERVIKS